MRTVVTGILAGMRYLLLGFLLIGCVHAPGVGVKIVTGAEHSPMWVCVRDPNDSSYVICEDFETALKIIFKADRSNEPAQL